MFLSWRWSQPPPLLLRRVRPKSSSCRASCDGFDSCSVRQATHYRLIVFSFAAITINDGLFQVLLALQRLAGLSEKFAALTLMLTGVVDGSGAAPPA
jgi:hypothetical protein